MKKTNGIRELHVLDLFDKYSTDEDVAALQAGFDLAYAGMTQHALASPQNQAMLGLLKLNCPMDLGMPAYLSDALLSDEGCLYTPETLVGLDDESLIDEYRGLKGYQFSWGVLSQVETRYKDPDDGPEGEELRYTTFGLSIEIVLRSFPRVDIWEYLANIYCTGDYEVSPDPETSMEASLLDFESDLADAADEETLRLWIAEQFLPRHLPLFLRYLCLWLYIHDYFPATFQKMWDLVRTKTYTDTVMEERGQPGVVVH